MTKLEKDAILPPRKPKLFKRFVDNIFTRLRTNVPNQLLEFLNNYHVNKVHGRVTKLTPHWFTSEIQFTEICVELNFYRQTSTTKRC